MINSTNTGDQPTAVIAVVVAIPSAGPRVEDTLEGDAAANSGEPTPPPL